MTIDETDHRILAMLARDGRRPGTDIAAELGVSEATVRARIGRLTDSGVMKVVALCDPLSLGHVRLSLFLDVVDLTPRAVALELARNALVGHVTLCSGMHDLLVEATCRDLTEVVSLLDDIRRTPGVSSIEQHIHTRLYKDLSWDGLRGSHGQRAAVDRA